MLAAAAVLVVVSAPAAYADNSRLNNSVIANVYTIQHQAGCNTNIKRDRALNGNVGSDGSTPQDRSAAAGFKGKVAETVAINPALAINNLDILNQWYYDPVDFGIMSDCANTVIGVWSENSLDRSVVVAVFGQPA